MADLKGKVALVTGGAQGLGYAIAEALMKNGCNVSLADIAEEKGEGSSRKLSTTYAESKCIFVYCDVTDEGTFQEAFKETEKKLGKVDLLVNNAGTMHETKWRLCVDLNIIGAIIGINTALKFMGKDNGGNGGTVMNLASVAGLVPVPYAPVYACTKHGIIGLTKSFSHPFYYDKHGVKFCALCPSFIDTPLASQGPSIIRYPELFKQIHGEEPPDKMNPEYVANAAIRLLTEGSNGSLLQVTLEDIRFV